MRKLFLLIFMWIFGITAFAAYLKNVPLTLTQPDGTTIECFATGDEYYNWVHDKDGYTIIRNDEGYLVYAVLKNDQLQSSGLFVGKDKPTGLTPWTIISAEERNKLRARKNMHAQSMERRHSEGQQFVGQNNGNINNVVIFVRFSGESEFTRPLSFYDDLHNKETSGFVSMYRFFQAISNDQTHLKTTFYPTVSNNQVLSFQDINPRNYYRPYHSVSNPTGYQNDDERGIRELDLLERTINAVKSDIPTSLNLDFNGDNMVDNISFVIKGGPDGWAELLWPHRWSIYDRYVEINGKRAYDFNLLLDDRLDVSVLSHEMFHTLGAPDLYRYYDRTIDPVGSWDVMCSNATPPQSPTAYVKYKYGGWMDNIPTITQSGTYTINNIWQETNNAYKIASPNSTSEFFVVEYRDENQFWDAGLPGSGLIITRINTAAGDGNADGPPDEIYVYRPNAANTTTNGTLAIAHFSSNVGRTEFSNTTNPPCFLSNNTLGNIHIRNISASGGETMSFEVVMSTYMITATTGTNGNIAPSGTVTVNHGANQAFTITPNTNYEIDQVLIDGVNNQAAVSSGSYQFANVTANHTIFATFKLRPDAKLNNIISNVPFTPSFNKSVYNYTMTVPCETDEVTITPVPSDGGDATMTINGTPVTMPIKINVGDAPKTLLIRSVNGSDIVDYSIQIISPYDYNKVVALIWDNVLSVINVPNHNGGYNFVSQQWIENGVLLNETGGNLYLSKRPNYQTAVYNVRLTANDITTTTCNQNPVRTTSQPMQVFPNPVKVGEIINVNTFLSDEELDGAKIRIINMQGALVKEVSAEYKTIISAPSTQGNYVLQITTKKGTTKTFNIVVQ